MKRKFSVLVLLMLLITSCGEYQKVLKNEDVKPKYDMAVKLYEEGMETGKNNRFTKSLRLLEQILPQYRGTPQGEKISYIYADNYFQLGDYFSSQYQFERFTKAYPTSEKVSEAAFKSAKSYYNVSPRYSLDQTETYKAIDRFQNYIATYPDGEYVAEANTLVAELREKLEKKAYKIAKQFHHIEDYKASISAMENFIEANPGSKYMEPAYFYKLDSAYLLAINSYRYLVKERLQEAKEYYEDYQKYYAEGEHAEKANEISADINQRLKNF
ncbi:outer membrane protein assembly factor BamD [Mesonia aquimarina]|uniref:outer membrane protein assembly factor BamD n=1 Tax=Mesonia aquimarina TaxID=1504967 RepID=UPI001F09BA32|nr:outer membrane protein assembly factor BamD [Mesonia aquimarina]